MKPKRIEKELAENEDYLLDEDIDMEVLIPEDATDISVYVKFTGFDTREEATEFGESLAETLPLLIFESTVLH